MSDPRPTPAPLVFRTVHDAAVSVGVDDAELVRALAFGGCFRLPDGRVIRLVADLRQSEVLP